MWPALKSAETLRPRLANRCRSVSRFDRLSPSTESKLLLRAALTGSPMVVELSASPTVCASLFDQ
jgi:hypothetical protein